MRHLPLVVIAGLLCGLAASPARAQKLQCNPCRHAFHKVTIGDSSSYSIQLTNTGNKTLRITSDSIQGSAFSVGNFPLPIKLKPGASVALPIVFTPTAPGHTTGNILLVSSAENPELTIDVAGRGVASHSVYLSWNPGNGDAVGYNLYRGTVDGGPYQKINPALDPSTNFTDYTVVSGTTYYYVATEVNAQGEESAYSNVGEAVIPN